jgi:CRP/FNR family transcriptional regulator/CRP/FNR family cyclic AMP-dependent transcriptional regulator
MQADLTDRITILQSLPLFNGLDNETLRQLAKNSRLREFHADQVICYQGDPGSTCHFVIQGKVRVFLVGEDGRELSVRILVPGEIFGEMALLEGLPRSANVEALENTQTLEIAHDVLLDCLRKSPVLALNLLQDLSARLRSSTVDAEELALLTVDERLTRQLHKLAEWSGVPVTDGVRIMVPMTQQELAALIGTSRESVNRALVRLRRQGKVRIEKGWIVLLSKRAPGTIPDTKSTQPE